MTPNPLPARRAPLNRLPVLLALAAADALGAATEFSSPEEARRRFPDGLRHFAGGSPFGFAAGEATDDTQMAVGLLAGLLEGGSLEAAPDAQLRAVQAHWLDWWGSHPPDIGHLTRQALSGARARGLAAGTHAWAQGGMDNAGNGGLMRVAAVWVAGLSGRALLATAATTTALTHADPRCVLSSVFLCALLERLDAGEAYPAAAGASWQDTRALAPELPGLLERAGLLAGSGVDVARYAERLVAQQSGVAEAVETGVAGVAAPQSGYVLHTLQMALVHNLNAPDWLTVAERAALGGDDSDTVGAVAGAIAGARGFAVSPDLLTPLRIGASWSDWQREWPASELERSFT